MTIPSCKLCEEQGLATPSTDLEYGDYCPTCHRPTCRQHLATVRFRWKETRIVDKAFVCRRCKDAYEHRYWDVARRDWIS